jgi:hypothetical protein
MDDMINDLHEEGKKKTGESIYMVTPGDFLKGLTDLLNKTSEKGFEFRGLIYTPIFKSGALLLFKPSKKVFKYTIKDSAAIAHSDSTKEAFEEIEKIGDIHATIVLWGIFPAPLYVVAEESKPRSAA